MAPKGISIRPVEASDRAALKRWGEDPCLQDWHQGADPAKEAARMLRSRYNFIVEELGTPIGAASIEGDWSRDTSAELGIMIIPERQGGGRGLHAVALTLNFAFRETPVHRVWHGALGSNEPVLRFFRRAGFVEEGRAREAEKVGDVWVDHVYFSILEQEWRKREFLGWRKREFLG